MKNLLELSEYVPSLHEDILEVICSHFLKIDVSLKSSLLSMRLTVRPYFHGWLRAAHTACQNGVCCHTNY